MEEEHVHSMHNGILPSYRKEQNSIIGSEVHRPGGHHVSEIYQIHKDRHGVFPLKWELKACFTSKKK